MRRVIVESPYAGDVATNVRYARACLRNCVDRGEAPLASHLLYTQEGVLDDSIAAERALGIAAGLTWGAAADATVVYDDLGISAGMCAGIGRAVDEGRPVEYRKIGERWRIAKRPTLDQYLMRMAALAATRSTCVRRSVGCVLADAHGVVLATGYNGVPRGMAHCDAAHPCPGAKSESGHGLDLCEAVHAEANALLWCRDKERIDTLYCTSAPCATCAKMLLNTPCRRVVYRDEYPGRARELWEAAGREWVKFENF